MIPQISPAQDSRTQPLEIIEDFRRENIMIKTQKDLQTTYIRYSLLSGINKARHDTIMSVIRVIRP